MAKKRIDPKLPIAPAGNSDDPATPLMKPDRYMDRLVRRLNELFLERDGGGIQILDEGVLLGEADALDFVGGAVTASLSATTGTISITSSAIAGVSVQDEGVLQGVAGAVDTLNFVGTPVTAAVSSNVATITVTGTGGTVDTLSAQASEALSQGNLVNIWNSAGNFRVRKADATLGAGYEAHGWIDANVSNGATATIRFLGKNTFSSGLTPGPVFLGTAGAATSTPPSTAGYLSQEVGAAESASSYAFEWHPDILISTPATISYGGTLQSQYFSASGTFTPPTNVTGVWLSGQGNGGGGGTRTGALGGGGGGAGEIMEMHPVPVSGAVTVTIPAAAAGAAAGGGNADGSTGGSVTFGTLATLLGGIGGKGALSNGGSGGGPNGGSGAGSIGPLGTPESPTYFGGSAGGGGATLTSANGFAGGAAAGFLSGAAGGTAASTQGGGGGGATGLQGLGGVGGGGGVAGTAAAANTGAGGGGAGGLTGNNAAGGNGGTGWLRVFWVS